MKNTAVDDGKSETSRLIPPPPSSTPSGGENKKSFYFLNRRRSSVSGIFIEIIFDLLVIDCVLVVGERKQECGVGAGEQCWQW